MERPILAVLMTVHDRRETTLFCLKHLFDNDTEKYCIQVYLVDDGCTDGTAEAVVKKYPDVNVIKGDGSLFWNRGMIRAWQEADKDNPDFFLWLNDDTMLFEHAVEIIMSDYKTLPELSVLSGATCATFDNNKVTYGGNTTIMLTPNGLPQRINVMNGNFVLIPKCVRKKIGINDPKFTHSYGDREYSIRCHKNGVDVYLTSAFVGTCDRHDNSKKCYDSRYGLIERLRYFYSPLGNPPSELFYLYSKEKGALFGVRVVVSHFIQVLFPKFAKKLFN